MGKHWVSSDLADKYLIRFKADEFWDFMRISYTAGEPIENLPPILDQIIDSLELSTQFWIKNKNELKKRGYYSSPITWSYAEYYLKVLGIISTCYLLQREDLLERLLNIILANSEDELEPDNTIEDFFYYRFQDRPDPDYIQ